MGDIARDTSSTSLDRRHMLQLLAGIGLCGPLADQLLAEQARGAISAETLKRASEVLREEFTPERLSVLERAVQRNVDQMQIVRDLVIDDRVEPAPIFHARAASPTAPARRSSERK